MNYDDLMGWAADDAKAASALIPIAADLDPAAIESAPSAFAVDERRSPAGALDERSIDHFDADFPLGSPLPFPFGLF